MTPDELTAKLKREALTAVAEIYDEPRLARAAFAAAEATEQLTREERIIVLANVLMPTLGGVSVDLFIETLSVLALSQHPTPGLPQAAWLRLAEQVGVPITPRPPHV